MHKRRKHKHVSVYVMAAPVRTTPPTRTVLADGKMQVISVRGKANADYDYVKNNAKQPVTGLGLTITKADTCNIENIAAVNTVNADKDYQTPMRGAKTQKTNTKSKTF